jgi:aarF domain-containing kinase
MFANMQHSHLARVFFVIILMMMGNPWIGQLAPLSSSYQHVSFVMVDAYQPRRHFPSPQQFLSRFVPRSSHKVVQFQNEDQRRHLKVLNAATATAPTIISPLTIPATPEDIQKIFSAHDSNRLKKAKLRLAEVQGILPYGFSENISVDALANFQQVLVSLPVEQLKPAVRARDITWKVAEPEIKYDPAAASKSISSWSWMVHSGKVFLPIGMFMMKILCDVALKQEESNRSKRARQLLQFLTAQSPALIKAGQSLSSRSDLLAKEYLATMETLQDRCPSFPNEKAFAVFEEEMGVKFHDVFELESPLPVAAASIGQVYKGKLKATGEVVAIKIQRPDCERQIAADLSVMRWYGRRVQDVIGMTKKNVDLVTIIDDFGELLYREIDYR